MRRKLDLRISEKTPANQLKMQDLVALRRQISQSITQEKNRIASSNNKAVQRAHQRILRCLEKELQKVDQAFCRAR